MKLKEITNYLESFAPLSYQESYDNAGLICGDENMEISAALICLDSTEAVIDEAIAGGFNLVIAHHPIVFSGIKKLNGKNYIERVLLKAIKNDIAIYAAHTNLDNVRNGVNAKICEKLDLIECQLLVPQKSVLKRLITYVPKENAEELRIALFNAGGGMVGNYNECSFNTTGTGTFKALDGANPYIGTVGKRFEGEEIKVEMVYPQYAESKIVTALLKAHPYEEVAYDLIALSNSSSLVGAGMVGELATEMDEMAFLRELKSKMKVETIRYTALKGKKVKKVAVCGGSGSFLLHSAIAHQADVFITADFKYHQFFDAEGRIIIADIGHYESEQFTMELFYEILKKKFSTFALQLTKINTNPIKYL
ncbi:MAG TPA: Nif3-like dinuclear metal center hexameric protein [Bacteroidia bacterium]|nr:Nif3-like dinuclear metal center hexameric protein [Bacteroidia bacterium]HRG53551.1 Nif3-like dinuclear metal center hexameric protein [Bacteroidia bacterium]